MTSIQILNKFKIEYRWHSIGYDVDDDRQNLVEAVLVAHLYPEQ
jgi:hypothetical protein